MPGLKEESMTQNIHQNIEETEGIVIDFAALFHALLRNAGIILAFALLGGLFMMKYTDQKETYQYKASVTVYVTNKSPDTEVSSVATADTTAAQALLKIYSSVITQNENFLNEVLTAADLSEKYKPSALGKAISSSAVNSTQIMTISVTMKNPKDAYNLARAIASVAPITLPSIIEGSSLSVVSLPSFPTSSVTKNLKKSLIIGGILGFLLGAALIILIEILDRRVKSPLQLELTMNRPVLGVIPGTEKTLYSENETPSYRDAWRTVRTNIRLLCGSGMVLGLIGPEGKEGTSSSALNLAVCSGETGTKTLLVDASLRKPSLDEKCGVGSEKGLVNLLRGECGLEDVLAEGLYPGVDLLPAGEAVLDSTVLLESEAFSGLLDSLRNCYQLVILDLPPMLRYPDALIAASKCDQAAIVVRHGETSLEKLSQMMISLRPAGTELTGFIYNDAWEGKL